ncbi:unnamed protein product, partial [Bubo scandiacus]
PYQHHRNVQKAKIFPCAKEASQNLSCSMNITVHAIQFLLIHPPPHIPVTLQQPD